MTNGLSTDERRHWDLLLQFKPGMQEAARPALDVGGDSEAALVRQVLAKPPSERTAEYVRSLVEEIVRPFASDGLNALHASYARTNPAKALRLREIVAVTGVEVDPRSIAAAIDREFDAETAAPPASPGPWGTPAEPPQTPPEAPATRDEPPPAPAPPEQHEAAQTARKSAAPATDRKKRGPIAGFARALLSLRGRLRRGQFWLAFFVVFVGGAYSTTQDQGGASNAIVALLTLYVALCAYGKRLHDFGWSAGFMIVPIGATFAFYTYLIVGLSGAGGRDFGDEILVLALALAGVWLLATLWVGIYPSQKGDNRFGADTRERERIPMAPSELAR